MKNTQAQTAKDWIQMRSSLIDLLKFTKSVIDELHGKPSEDEFKRVLFEFIIRFHLNFTVIANSWNDFLNNSKFKFPFFILLRSLISDLIIMLYLMDGLKIDRKKKRIVDDEFKMRFIEISNSHFAKIEREIKSLCTRER